MKALERLDQKIRQLGMLGVGPFESTDIAVCEEIDRIDKETRDIRDRLYALENPSEEA